MEQPGESITVIIAIYGALVATVSIGWQVYTWHQSRKPQVIVEVSQGLPGIPNPEWWVMINVINRENHAVRISSLGFNLQDGSGRSMVLINPPPAATLPGEVAAHDQGFTYVAESSPDIKNLDLCRPLVAWARLATGELYKSKPKKLRSQE
jgi:hypothetical protein